MTDQEKLDVGGERLAALELEHRVAQLEAQLAKQDKAVELSNQEILCIRTSLRIVSESLKDLGFHLCPDHTTQRDVFNYIQTTLKTLKAYEESKLK